MLLGYAAYAMPILALPVRLLTSSEPPNEIPSAAAVVMLVGSVLLQLWGAVYSSVILGFSAKPKAGLRLSGSFGPNAATAAFH